MKELKIKIKKDFLGNVLTVGDEVVFMRIGCRSLAIGKILKLNDFKATIEWEHPYNKRLSKAWQEYNQILKR